jgi:hypothetical protein
MLWGVYYTGRVVVRDLPPVYMSIRECCGCVTMCQCVCVYACMLWGLYYTGRVVIRDPPPVYIR